MELDTWFNNYAIDNNMTLAEARRRLTPMEMRTYKSHMERMKKIYNASHSPFVKAEIDRLGARAYVTRQMALIDSIDKILIETSHNVQVTMEDHLIGMYQREYKNTMEQFRIQGTVIPERAIREIINYPYAGNMFSDRIWNNKNRLINYIEKDLAKGLIKGSSIQSMSKDLMNRCDVLYYQAARLIRTETNYVMNQGHLNGYKDAGIKEYKFLAFIDNRTSPQCKDLDGQIINANDATVGTNMPPLHPNCRSTIIPIVTRNYLNNMKEENIFNDDPAGDVLIFKDKKEAANHAINNLGFKEVN